MLNLIMVRGAAFAGLCWGQGAHASSEALDYYASLSQAVGLGDRGGPMLASFFALMVLLVVGLFFKQKVQSSLAQEVPGAPDGTVGVVFVVGGALGFLDKMAADLFEEDKLRYLGVLSTLFLFVLLNNLLGLVPGLPPATENFAMNLGLGLLAFGVYNYAGIRAHGIGYIKQFMGPMVFLAPVFLLLETISHLARPLSLAFRLTANVFGDHMLLSVFSGLAPVVVPVFFLFFGILVAFIQSFVFTMLTGVYISMAISHDH
jgi:F-type H+-transporting ATPase subunit a